MIKLERGRKYSMSELDAIFDFTYKRSSGIKTSKKSGEIIVFSYSKSKYQDYKKDGVIYYKGQNTGTSDQKLKYGNKDLYDAYERGAKICFFRDRCYRGQYTIIQKPYKADSGQWVSPLQE